MSCELSYASLKSNHFYRDQEVRALQERKRNILYLIENYLQSENLSETLCCLQQEARLTSEQYTLCDNVDLACILQEYEDYYYLRFNKHPKLTKKLEHSVDKKISTGVLKRSSTRVKSAPPHKTQLADKPPHEEQFGNIVITPLTKPVQLSPTPARKLEPPQHLPEEWKPFVDIISQEIFTRDVQTRWSDVIGLDSAKKFLHEAVVYPIRYPELFHGLLSPWKGILLHGPPGTGKTLLARAVATECSTTFFNVSASTLISKWRGESEKLVRVLFSLARSHAPSTIFIDEIDALMSRRDSEDHEASRRLKAELLIQLDGLNTSEDRVFLLATSNVPWDLDTAMLRRFEKRVLVDIPDLTARMDMLRYYLPPVIQENPRLCAELDYATLAKAMEGYSGSDIKILCKEVAMQRVRDTFEILDRMTHTNHAQIKSHVKLKRITTQQVLSAIQQTKPCANYKQYYDKYYDM